jgi:hypothetical protein
VKRLNGATFWDAVIDSYRDMGVAISAMRFSQKYHLWWCMHVFGDNHTKDTPNYIFHSTGRPDRWSKSPCTPPPMMNGHQLFATSMIKMNIVITLFICLGCEPEKIYKHCAIKFLRKESSE